MLFFTAILFKKWSFWNPIRLEKYKYFHTFVELIKDSKAREEMKMAVVDWSSLKFYKTR